MIALSLLCLSPSKQQTRVMRLVGFRSHVIWILSILATTVSISILIGGEGSWRGNTAGSSVLNSWRNSNSNNKEIVVSVEIVAENRTIQHTYREREAYYRDLPTWLDRYSFLPAPNEVPDEQRVCLVHVGKTAGNTLCCFLGYKASKCNNQMQLLPGNLPQYATNILHVNRDSCRLEKIGLYLFTVREPLHRLMSWFTYERPTSNQTEMTPYRLKKIKPLYVDCGFDSIAQLGEAMSSKDDPVCASRAWWAVTGAEGYAYHNQMNYGFYWNALPQQAQKSARFAVIRTEHLEKDWYSVERVSLDYHGPIVDKSSNATIFGIKNESVKQKRDTVLSELARHNLCAGLCREIQIYKRILRRAENLSPDDWAESLKELEESCPLQAATEDCPEEPY